MNIRTHVSVVILIMLCAIGAGPTTRPGNFMVSRLDVADAYVRLDRAATEHPPTDPAEKTRVHAEFDRALVLYFNKEHSQAVQLMNELTESLDPSLSRSPEARFARSLRVRVAPWVAQEKRPSPLRVKLSPMYDVPINASIDLRLVIRQDNDDLNAKPVFDRKVQVDPSGMAQVFNSQQPEAPVGRYRIELVAPDGAAHVVGRWFVADRPIELMRLSNEQRLARISRDSRQIHIAQNAVSSRNALLGEHLSETDVSRALADPLELAPQVEREVKELESDRDPFVSRSGEYYRTFLVGSMSVPARVYAPKGVIESGQPAPLVIALHGAGGEEGQFMTAYGAGLLKRLADEKGFIVVAPSTYYVMTAPDAVRAFVEELALDYLIDRSRVYAIGHSLGALTAESWAARYADQLSAVVLLAGASDFPDKRDMSPTLMLLADHDPIFSLDSMKRVVEQAKRQRLPVEMRVLENTGHALLVNEALPDAVEWMLGKKKQ